MTVPLLGTWPTLEAAEEAAEREAARRRAEVRVYVQPAGTFKLQVKGGPRPGGRIVSVFAWGEEEGGP